MTGNGQDVSLRHLKIGHRVLEREKKLMKYEASLLGVYIKRNDSLSLQLLILFRSACTKCGARKFKMARGSIVYPNPNALLIDWNRTGNIELRAWT